MKIFLEKILNLIGGKSNTEILKEQIPEKAVRNDELPFWCAAANVKKESIYGEEHLKRRGTKHFRGGAKVYIADAYWGMCNSVTVIGHHRRSGRYFKMDIHVKRLENFRLELVYSPKVAELIQRNFDDKEYALTDGYIREYAEKIVESLPLWVENYHEEK